MGKTKRPKKDKRKENRAKTKILEGDLSLQRSLSLYNSRREGSPHLITNSSAQPNQSDEHLQERQQLNQSDEHLQERQQLNQNDEHLQERQQLNQYDEHLQERQQLNQNDEHLQIKQVPKKQLVSPSETASKSKLRVSPRKTTTES